LPRKSLSGFSTAMPGEVVDELGEPYFSLFSESVIIHYFEHRVCLDKKENNESRDDF
jgi:hypothetical protein